MIVAYLLLLDLNLLVIRIRNISLDYITNLNI